MKKHQLLTIIPHYNDLRGLHYSLTKITETKDFMFDLLIVDDGSSIKPNLAQLKSWFKYGQVYYLENHNNRGIEYVLNDGLDFAKNYNYKYIARLDCGDLSHANRFSIQYHFLEQHPDIALLGGWCTRVDLKNNTKINFCPPTKHEEIIWHMRMHTVFVHPLVMFRTKVLELVPTYPLGYHGAEDYAFFSKIIKHYTSANLDQILLDYEINNSGISLTKRRAQILATLKVILKNFKLFSNSWLGLFWYLLLLILPYQLINKIKKLIL